MAYQLKCRNCNHSFQSQHSSAHCPRSSCFGRSSHLASDIVELAVDVAVAYTGVGMAIDIADAGLSFIGSIFD